MKWNPFRKYHLKPVIVEQTSLPMRENPIVRLETEKAQLRSLKARTEITMLYESLAEQTLYKLKGHSNEASL